MRIFRVSMPRKYLTETDARLLLRSALLVKVKTNYNYKLYTPRIFSKDLTESLHTVSFSLLLYRLIFKYSFNLTNTVRIRA